MKIAVYAASAPGLSGTYLDAAFELGVLMAEGGHTLVYGGGKGGLMGRVFEGISSCGGKSMGIAPKFFDEPGALCRDCSEFIFTETMAQRKTLMEDTADAFIVLPGGMGTMEEFFETLTLRQLGCHAKPIAIVNINGCYDALTAMLTGFAEEGLMSRRALELFGCFTSPAQALEYVSTQRTGSAAVSVTGYSL